ncbi:CpsD/CapB family tyrosine-protein kinase [Streptococcus suis]|uniref:CpsD/CapB family tyrosine-protein kinase n=1 Tax=Streptococcus suis TaxID=1307 RepID=UPI0004174ACF|nr:CpsD/CapB family tyrosine-protein kinase [Streptococcus suis]AUC91332.1 exopolysaccharide biosynthesis protein [Streptococcus suis]MBY5025097.1 CpsD/CapB family tyrosine-protein kinase [Streptococcus suis]QZT18304.1 CpsD/CapB family tyrosine-protein kinase [Streptococcus suis]
MLFKKKRRNRQSLAVEQKKGAPLYTYVEPESQNSERIRMLRTNLEFIQVNDSLKSIAVTSSIPGEGKSTVAANLAVSLTATGKNVLLVDTDLRRPTVHKTLRVSRFPGISDLILNPNIPAKDVICFKEDVSLFVMPAGELPSNPSELLASQNMKKIMEELEKHFDYIIYDVPPINSVTDPQIIASRVDGVILVVRSGYVHKDEVRRSRTALENVEARILGCVLNDVPMDQDDKYYYYKKE